MVIVDFFLVFLYSFLFDYCGLLFLFEQFVVNVLLVFFYVFYFFLLVDYFLVIVFLINLQLKLEIYEI